MSQPVIVVEGVSKEYVIGARERGNENFREMLTSSLLAPFRRFRKLGGQDVAEEDRFWALRDVSFEVPEGEVVGIIGRNGAGKSTLLKILSRITEPTTGRVTLRGRVASLLEVGTGFHPELTGRENIFLNGAILGMTRAEISRKFDEIVNFAGIEKFLDTPVKRYSSGMYVRLAFSVAAHLDPEILIVDEVLAVGDVEFQKKCLGKMQSVAGQGRTVLLVSHNLNAVQTLCHRAILLDKGRIACSNSDVNVVIDRLLNESGGVSSLWRLGGDEYSSYPFAPREFFIGDEEGNPIGSSLMNNDTAYIYIVADVDEEYSNLCVGYTLSSEDGLTIYTSYSIDFPEKYQPVIRKGRVRLRSPLPQRTLNEGKYYVELIANFYPRGWMFEPGAGRPRVSFEIRGGLSDSPKYTRPRAGVLALVLPWENGSADGVRGGPLLKNTEAVR